ncbi:MAG: M48 family metallopeptidase, partial [Leptonema sp. (in: Bacteria)]|nr:M48 family metallopeptidase [Leptonema sp. (in: bacteria)]
WEIVVFRSPDVNAFALPGGKIGVFTGLLSVATTQDQLAAVLGHEVAHVTKRHGKQRVQQQVIAQGGMAVLEGVIGDNEMLMAAVGVGAQYGVLLPFSRAHESEADLVGLDYLAKAGFNPQGAVQLWQNMEAAGGGKQPEMLSTHPSGSTRIKDLQSKMTKALQTQAIAKNMGKNPKCK